MRDEVVQQIVSHLNEKGFLSEDVAATGEIFMRKLFTNNDERKEILKGLILAYSEEYRCDLERAVKVDIVLAKKFYELGFVEEKDKFNFVLGKGKKEELQKVYEKLLTLLHLLITTEEDKTNELPLTLTTEILFNLGTEYSAHNKIKKQRIKKFNLKNAMQNLDSARKTLQDATQFMDQQRLLVQPEIPQWSMEARQNEESRLTELASVGESFRLTMERHISLHTHTSCPNESSCLAELGASVSELYSGLQFLADHTQSSSAEGIEARKKIDLEKIMTQTEEMEKNSAVTKCFSSKDAFSEEERRIYD